MASPTQEHSQPSLQQIDVWTYTRKLSNRLVASVVVNVIFALGCVALAFFIVTNFNNPPLILQQDRGFLETGGVQHYRLREDMVESFLIKTVGTLMSHSPDREHYEDLLGLCAPVVLKSFYFAARNAELGQAKFNSYQFWRPLEMKRYFDPRLRRTMCVAIRSETINVSDFINEMTFFRDTKIQNARTMILAYLTQVRPTKKNPWGLYLLNIREEDKESKAMEIWNNAYPLTRTKSLRGKVIQPAPEAQTP